MENETPDWHKRWVLAKTKEIMNRLEIRDESLKSSADKVVKASPSRITKNLNRGKCQDLEEQHKIPEV